MAIVRKLGLLLATCTVLSLGLIALTSDAAGCKYNNGHPCPQESPCCTFVRISCPSPFFFVLCCRLYLLSSLSFSPSVSFDNSQENDNATAQLQKSNACQKKEKKKAELWFCCSDNNRQHLNNAILRLRALLFSTSKQDSDKKNSPFCSTPTMPSTDLLFSSSMPT